MSQLGLTIKIFAAVTVLVSPAAIRWASTRTIEGDPGSVSLKMVSNSRAPLKSFFDGVPVSPWARDLEAVNARRDPRRQPGAISLATKIQHFFGIGAVVYASGGCGGSCNESQTSQSCGCGTSYSTYYSSERTGNGVQAEDMCTDCSTIVGGTTCSPDPPCAT